MADVSKIEWTDSTWNPWEGCQKVGPGCDHCYAETRNARYGGGVATNWGPGAPRRRTSTQNWRKPLAWQRGAAAFREQHGRRQRVFCASLADVFDNAVDPSWRRDLFHLIDQTPDLDWLLLTKRVGNVRGMLTDVGYTALPEHVLLGATVVNQAEADRDVPKLLDAPAARRFLSMEPLLGPVDLRPYIGRIIRDAMGGYEPELLVRYPRPDWVIVGGESGPGARPMDPRWAEDLLQQCKAAEVPFLFKQWGEFRSYRVAGEDPRTIHHDRIGKKAAGRLLHGVEHNGFYRELAA